MSLLVASQPVPIAMDQDGVARVGGTRVTLASVVNCFRDGMAAEGIVEKYPTLRLADVYAVISYYLDHADQVNAYLREQQVQAEQTRKENEARFDPIGIRARLLARRG
jgi:uncharacterized protein (DUF433 family)